MKMWAAFILITFLYMPVNTKEASSQCDKINNTTLIWSNFHNCPKVILKDKGINEIVTNENSYYGNVSKLDISSNKIRDLPDGFLSNAIILNEVHLQENNLVGLPENFLINSSNLKILGLEGNQLPKIPASVFHNSLENLTVDCECNVVNSLLVQIDNASKYPKLNAKCKLPDEWKTPRDFYEEHCGKQYLALYIVLPILVIAFVAGGVALYMLKRKTSLSSIEGKGAADKSPVHGQPRYMSTNMEGTATTLNPGQKQDYENVFVGYLPTTETKPYGYLKKEHESGTHSKHTTEDDLYLESDVNEGDQPIYTNTQGIYYNYSEPKLMKSKSKEEDVYILPDH